MYNYIFSDHSYCDTESVVQDHEYDCSLFGQDDLIEEDKPVYNDVQRKILKVLPPIKTTSQYDFTSILKTKSVTDISEDDLFTDIFNEMKIRYS